MGAFGAGAMCAIWLLRDGRSGKSAAIQRYLLGRRVRTGCGMCECEQVVPAVGEGLCRKVVKGRVNESSGWKAIPRVA